ncbi:hypothetical protein [Herpetosiphon geysericola]|uniref:Uncharacterized protein n=1 Tax=Herpetosiphon geysericola TaxID=70996 RepID=A0A0P6YKU4_9CHLR|nr:hypothetical protein [Herpetosiphon geysericola]KPL85844.1 hypothetical protein SE18_13015 [Herpetosiphon geysericola]
MNNSQFTIYIFTNEDINHEIDDKPHITDPNILLATIDLERAAYVIPESAIIAYDWPEQTFKITNPWHDRLRETPFFMHEGSKAIVVFQQQRIMIGSLLSEDTARFIAPEETALYSSFRQDHIFYSFRYGSVLQTAQAYPFLNPDPIIAEAVKAHFRQLGKLIE